MSLSLRIFALLCLPVILLGGVFGLFVHAKISEQIQAERVRLEESAHRMESTLNLFRKEMLGVGSFIAKDWGRNESIREGELDLLFQPFQDLYADLGISSWLVDENNKVLVRGHKGFSQDDNLNVSTPKVNESLYGYIEGSHHLLIRFNMLLNGNDSVSLILGHAINEKTISKALIGERKSWKMFLDGNLVVDKCMSGGCNTEKIQTEGLKSRFKIGDVEVTLVQDASFSRFNQDVRKIIYMSIFFFFALVVLLIFARHTVTSFLTHPLNIIIEKMEKYENKDDTVIASIRNIAEFSRVHDAFVLMQQDIFSKKNEIESSIAAMEFQKEKLNKENNLLRVLSHDIANPSSTIALSANYLLKKGGVPKEKHKYLQKIKDACQAIDEIIEHVRDMKAIESGKKDLQLRKIDLEETIIKANEIFEDKLIEKELEIVLVDDRKSSVQNTFFKAENVSFQNCVIHNIVSNAIKFSYKQTKIQFVISGNASAFVLSIVNTGEPLDAEKAKTIFDYGTATTTKGTRGEVGTGFGLPVAKSYMELYGADIWATTIGEDVHFVLTFPAHIESQEGAELELVQDVS